MVVVRNGLAMRPGNIRQPATLPATPDDLSVRKDDHRHGLPLLLTSFRWKGHDCKIQRLEFRTSRWIGPCASAVGQPETVVRLAQENWRPRQKPLAKSSVSKLKDFEKFELVLDFAGRSISSNAEEAIHWGDEFIYQKVKRTIQTGADLTMAEDPGYAPNNPWIRKILNREISLGEAVFGATGDRANAVPVVGVGFKIFSKTSVVSIRVSDKIVKVASPRVSELINRLNHYVQGLSHTTFMDLAPTGAPTQAAYGLIVECSTVKEQLFVCCYRERSVSLIRSLK